MTAQVFIHAVKTASVGRSGTVLTAEKSRQPRGVLRSTPVCREHPSKRHMVSRSGLPRSRPRYRESSSNVLQHGRDAASDFFPGDRKISKWE